MRWAARSSSSSQSDIYKMEDTPERIGKMVRATFTGTGSKKILLIAHMDTVYQRGMLAKQPFRIDGDRAYGLGIADDKQGVALILHTLAMLKALDFSDYGTLTVLINADEEIELAGLAQPPDQARRRARRDLLGRKLARGVRQALARDRRHRLGDVERRRPRLARRRRAGARRQRALRARAPDAADARPVRPRDGPQDELDHGERRPHRNMIPPSAQAQADVRVLRVADYDGIEKTVRERIKNKLLPDTKVE